MSSLLCGKMKDHQADAMGALIRAGFEPEDDLRAVGLPPIKHTGAIPVRLQHVRAADGLNSEEAVDHA